MIQSNKIIYRSQIYYMSAWIDLENFLLMKNKKEGNFTQFTVLWHLSKLNEHTQ